MSLVLGHQQQYIKPSVSSADPWAVCATRDNWVGNVLRTWFVCGVLITCVLGIVRRYSFGLAGSCYGCHWDKEISLELYSAVAGGSSLLPCPIPLRYLIVSFLKVSFFQVLQFCCQVLTGSSGSLLFWAQKTS